MNNVEDLKSDYNKFVKSCLDNGVNPYDILTNPMGTNKKLFNSLIKVFNKHLEKGLADNEKTKIFDVLYDEYKKESLSSVYRLSCGDDSYFDITAENYKLGFVDVLYVMKEFNNVGYLELKDGKLKPINLEARLENLNDVNKLVGKSKYKLYEGLIAPDGKFYVSLNEHTCMCMYMIANGIDVKGALRITQMPDGNRQFSLSSCNYLTAFSIKGFEGDNNIMITDAQAKSLYKFFKAIKSENKGGGQSLMQIIARSVNLGWDFVNTSIDNVNISLKHARRNMQTLEDNLEGEFDGKVLYRKTVQYGNMFGLTENQN